MSSGAIRQPRFSGSGQGAALGLILLLVLGAGLLWAPTAQAQTQTSGSILLGPDCCQSSPGNVGSANETVHIGVAIQSTSQIGGTFVDATAIDTTTVILGCTSSSTTDTCTGTELAALTFDSCTPAAGVTSCIQDLGNPNHVLITFPAGGKTVTTALGGTQVATITAHFTPGQQVVSPSSGQFFVLGNTGGGHLTTGAASGDAGGSAPLFFPVPAPTLTLTKSCTATFNPATQQVDVSFTSTLTNTGTFEGITGISCSDVPAATLTGAPTVLAAGGTAGDSATFTGTYNAGTNLSPSDTLTCSGHGATSAQAVSVNQTASCQTSPSPAIMVAKTCTAAVNGAGTAINVSFSGTVSNNGNEDLNSISCSDVPAATLSGVPTGTLVHGTSAGPITGSYSVASGASGVNTLNDTLTCSGKGVVSSQTVSGQGPASCQATLSPSITLAKNCKAAFNQATQSVDVTFTATLTNNGNEAVNAIGCNDTPAATLSGVQTSLAPGGSATITGTYNAGSNLSPSDSLTCSGTSAISSTALSQTAPASCTTTVAPQATLTKSCVATINQASQTVDVSFTATLQNTGPEGIKNITCTDSPAATLSGVPTGTLAPGGSATITGTYNNGASSAASDTLTCTATGAISNTQITPSGNATCSTPVSSNITVAKQCHNRTGTQTMDITAQVCNPAASTENLTNITCTDDVALTNVTGLPIASLTPGQCATVTGTYTATTNPSSDTLTCTGTGAISSQTHQNSGQATCTFGAEICRTPGFWGNHPNVTQLALDQAMAKIGGPLTICGEVVDNTTVPDQASALEAICEKPPTDKTKPLQVARDLITTALNCGISNDTPALDVCAGVSIDATFTACNAACATTTGHTVTATVGGQVINCGDALDCFNNGLVFHPDTGICGPEVTGCHDETTTIVGACSISGELCTSTVPCPAGAGDCKPGPASPGACKAARFDNCTIFGGSDC